jgi:hypothetical protein
VEGGGGPLVVLECGPSSGVAYKKRGGLERGVDGEPRRENIGPTAVAYWNGQMGGEGMDKWLGPPFCSAQLKGTGTTGRAIGSRVLMMMSPRWRVALKHGRRVRRRVAKRKWVA